MEERREKHYNILKYQILSDAQLDWFYFHIGITHHWSSSLHDQYKPEKAFKGAIWALGWQLGPTRQPKNLLS